MLVAFKMSRLENPLFQQRLVCLSKRVGPVGVVIRRIAAMRTPTAPGAFVVAKAHRLTAPLVNPVKGRSSAPLFEVVESGGYRLMTAEYGSAIITKDLPDGNVAILPATFQIPTKVTRSGGSQSIVVWMRPSDDGDVSLTLKTNSSSKHQVALHGDGHPRVPKLDSLLRADLISCFRSEMLSAAAAIETALEKNAALDAPLWPAVMCRANLRSGSSRSRVESILWMVAQALIDADITFDPATLQLTMADFTQDGSPQSAVLRLGNECWRFPGIDTDVAFSRFLQPLCKRMPELQTVFDAMPIGRGMGASAPQFLKVSNTDLPSAHARFALMGEYQDFGRMVEQVLHDA
jgi:peptidoglycan/xylan/chitin deacetylase (PgdA/CDA1 family)